MDLSAITKLLGKQLGKELILEESINSLALLSFFGEQGVTNEIVFGVTLREVEPTVWLAYLVAVKCDKNSCIFFLKNISEENGWERIKIE